MLKSDGNGGYNIQKGSFTMIMVIIALVSCIATVVAYGVTIKADVNFLKETVERVSIDHPIYVEDVDKRFDEHASAILVNQQQILAMHDDIKEIKTDLKELINK